MPCKYAQNVIILKQIWSNWQTWQENFVLSFFFFFITDLSIHLLSSLNLFILSVRKLVISYYFASLFPSPIGMWLVHFYLTFSVSVHIVWKCLIFLLCVYFFFVCVCVRVCVWVTNSSFGLPQKRHFRHLKSEADGNSYSHKCNNIFTNT